MNNNLKIEELADNIWRVRMARDGRWPESAMNRYGVIADMPVRAVRPSLDFGKVTATCEQVGKGFRLRFPANRAAESWSADTRRIQND